MIDHHPPHDQRQEFDRRAAETAALEPEGRAPSHRTASVRIGHAWPDRDRPEILDVIAERYRQVHTQGFAGRLRIESMTAHVGAEPMSIRLSLAHLVESAVLAIKPGSGRRPHEYLLALPKCAIAEMEPDVVDGTA